jgi:shikimate kinase
LSATSSEKHRHKHHIALVGFMASGKSTTGRRLARLLGWPFCDTDAEIVRIHGPIEEIFQREGEAAFRQYEREAIERALSREVRSVIAVGGGAPAHEPTRTLLSERAQRVFLDASIEQIMNHLRRAATTRPMLGTNPDDERVRALYEERLPFYREAEISVDCSGLKVEKIARCIQERLRLLDLVP